ncbi:MAG: flagella basal body P-ring formation protein FlgA, partial [Rhodothermales bacterium]
MMPQGVVAQGDVPTKTRIKRLAEQELAMQFPDAARRLEVRVKRVSRDFGEATSLRLSFTAGEGLPRGTTQVTVFGGSDRAGWEKAGWALLYVAHYDSVLVARAAFRVGEEVQTENAAVTWMETTPLREPLRPEDWLAYSESGPVYAARSIREGQVLRRSDVRAAYAAEPGETIVMGYRRGGLFFELLCKAREA